MRCDLLCNRRGRLLVTMQPLHLGFKSLLSRLLEVVTAGFCQVLDNLDQVVLVGILEHPQINIAYARTHRRPALA
jgi:hypothetical protein